jgi:hypothetical protein
MQVDERFEGTFDGAATARCAKAHATLKHTRGASQHSYMYIPPFTFSTCPVI